MQRTVLIGLDGATFTVLDPFMESGVMPFLRRFTGDGVRAELLSTPNPLTAQAWPSMTTSRSPANCGVFDFIRFETRKDGPFVTTTDSRDLRSETIWSIASRSNRRVTTLNFYAMYPPRPVAGHSVSGFVPFRQMKSAVYPPSLYERMKSLPGFNAKELAMDLDLEKKCINGLPHEEYEAWIRLHIRRERQWFELLRHLMTNEPSDLTAIVFDGVDKLQHLCWRFIDPRLFPDAPSPWEKHIRELCLEYFQQLDGFLSEIVTLAGSGSRAFIVSDHGFGATTELFYVNAWLHDHGYLHWTRDDSQDDGEGLTVNRMRTHLELVDWTKTKAHAITPSSNGIFIQRAEDASGCGVCADEYEQFRRELMESLLEFKDPETGEPVVKRIRTREEAYPGAEARNAPDLLLTLRDGGFVSILNSDRPLKPRTEPVGTHRPEGIFIAGGSGLGSGIHLDPLSILDVAPTVLHSLGLPIPENFEGRLAAGAFEPSYLDAHPASFEHAADQAGSLAADLPAEHDPEIEAVIFDQLEALGYYEKG